MEELAYNTNFIGEGTLLRINRLTIGTSRAVGVTIKRGHQEQVEATVLKDCKSLEALSIEVVAQVQKIKKDRNLSHEGKAKAIQLVTEEAAKKRESLDLTDKLVSKIVKYDFEREGAVKKVRDKVAPVESVVTNQQAFEIRQAMRDERIQKKAEYDAQLEEAKNSGDGIPLELKSFTDPLEARYLACCKDYEPKHEQFLKAVDMAPYPIFLLSEDVVAQGVELLKKSIAPELSLAYELTNTRLEAYQHLLEATREITASPADHYLSKEQKVAQPDSMAPLEPIQ